MNSTKENIIEILSGEELTAKQIHLRLQREYSFEGTYQATHKTLKQMIENNVLIKKENDYSINENWAENFKKKAETITEKRKQINLEEMKEGESINLSFNGIREVGWFLVNTAMVAPNPEKKPGLALWRFCYSLVGLDKKHIEGAKKAFSQNEWHCMVENNKPVDKMFGETLKEYGAKQIKFGVKGCATKLSDKVIIGSYITEIIYPSTFRKLWEIQNSLPKKVAEFNLAKHFGLMADKFVKIEVIVTKNEEMAEGYREEYLYSTS